MSRRLAIIGLDCAEPSLVFGPWWPRLPHLAALMERGRWGRLASCHPPITVPAWACMASGLDPGQLGLYGFHNRAGHHYGELALASGAGLQAPCLWDLAGAAGLTSVVLGVPLTYPPRPIKGALVAGFPAPARAALTWPRSLGPLLERWAGGPYLPDIEDFRHLKPADLLAQAETMARRRFAVAQGLYRQYGPEAFMLVEIAPDRVQHALWDESDPGQEAIARHYELLDGLVGDFLAGLEPGTLVLVVSDHGCQRRQGNLAVNEWLISQGYLRLKARPPAPAPLQAEMVDWPATRAWSEGGYLARIYLNIEGREPQGVVPPDQVPALKAEITARLEAMPGPGGAPLGNQVLDPLAIYRQTRGCPPDLMLYPGGLAWRASGQVRPGEGAGFFLAHNDTGPDQANHAPQGIVIAGLAGGGTLAQAGQEVVGASLYDVLPSALAWLGIQDLDREAGPGRAWRWLC
ncbi:MAG: alkaline phosphatase family protein [Desulfarculus sp.]|nr:alkaline phosphatase family protein [Desulfarculus sp.]